MPRDSIAFDIFIVSILKMKGMLSNPYAGLSLATESIANRVNNLAKYAISDSAEFSGEWFLPGDENHKKISGVLSWSSDKAKLQLNDSLTPPESANIFGDEVQRYDAVHGITIKGQSIALLKPLVSGSHTFYSTSGNIRTVKLISNLMVIGDHVQSQTLYKEIRARIPGLQLWIGRSSIAQTLLPKTDQSPAAMNYYVEGLPEELLQIPSISASLGLGIDTDHSGDSISEFSVKTSACLRIRPDTAQELDWFIAQLGKATTLLSLLSGSPMSPDHISAKVDISGSEIEILVALRESSYCSYKAPHEFFMLRNGMGVELSAVFSKWFEVYESIAAPSQLALSVLCSDKLWLHVEFLTLMQALEGFHRATCPDSSFYTSEASYESIRSAISQAIPNYVASDHKDALNSRIKYGNEVSLRKRLDLLVKCLPEQLRKSMLTEQGTVPSRWVLTRNYYTHWDKASKAEILDGLEMHQASVRMRLLLRVLYLNFLGIPEAAIANSLRNESSESQYLIQLNHKRHRDKNSSSNAGVITHSSINNSKTSD